MKYIEGSIDISRLHLTRLPDLQGVTVERYFRCDQNKLQNLEGAPEVVGSYLYAMFSQLTSLKGSPKRIGGDFMVYNNNLTSLEGCPEYVGGDFDIANNTRQFTEEEVRAVCDVKGKVYI